MSFASAFLGASEDATLDDSVGEVVETLLKAVSPDCVVGPQLPNVRASNLCFGVPMNWAIGGGQRKAQIRGALRERLERFEPRLELLSEIELQENPSDNAVTFYIAGAVRQQGQSDRFEIETKLSRMDQY
ncbi:MAG: GPW/gp25 family protein [Pseudomonadota bacterium]